MAIVLVNGIIQDNRRDKLVELLKQQMTQQDSLLQIQQTQIDSLSTKAVRRDNEQRSLRSSDTTKSF